MRKTVLLLLVLSFIFVVGGCEKAGETVVLGGVEFQIQNAEYDIDKLIITLSSNESVSNARIDVIDENSKLMCTKYENIESEVSKIEMADCGVREKITVSVSPPKGGIVMKEFSLEFPLLELKEGFKYNYRTAHCHDCQRRDVYIYVTKETDSYWEGISGIKIEEGKVAHLIRWMINKDDLDLFITMPLKEGDLLGAVDYTTDISQMTQIGERGESLLGFWIILLREMMDLEVDKLINRGKYTLDVGNGEEGEFTRSEPHLYNNYMAYTIDVEVYKDERLKDKGKFVISRIEPYLMMHSEIGNGPQMTFKSVEEKEFSVDDFKGYSIKEFVAK